MAEVHYRGTKIVTVSPDYADNTKFADEWMLCATGADGALAMAMGHVILSECFMQHRIPFFDDYVRQYTDLPIHIAAYAVVARKFVEADTARGERVGRSPTTLLAASLLNSARSRSDFSFTTISITSLSVP
jgi:nitrate reductase alpha subunit